MAQSVGFFSRIGLSLAVLFDGVLAARVKEGQSASPEEQPQKELPPAAPKPEPAARPDPHQDEIRGALHLLAILQRDGRLVDFLEEDVAAFSDGDIGAAARVVHEGCKKALNQYFTLKPVRDESEGAAIKVEAGFDANALRLTGNVAGDPPFSGKLAHAGWRAEDVKLPALGKERDANLVAPAEVEL
jgi:hypothetical protein